MAEIYPVRASGEYAGTFCDVSKPRNCLNYARFVVHTFNSHDITILTCGQHLSPVVKGIQAYGRAAIVQEVPGQRNSETVYVDGELRTLAPADRKVIERR